MALIYIFLWVCHSIGSCVFCGTTPRGSCGTSYKAQHVEIHNFITWGVVLLGAKVGASVGVVNKISKRKGRQYKGGGRISLPTKTI